MATVPPAWKTATLNLARANPLMAQVRAGVADMSGALASAKEGTLLISNGEDASVAQAELDQAIADAAPGVQRIKDIRAGIPALKALIDQVDLLAAAVDDL